MTVHTVRDARGLVSHAELEDALAALTGEHLAHRLHPRPDAPQVLELLSTADDEQADGPGPVIVLASAAGDPSEPESPPAAEASTQTGAAPAGPEGRRAVGGL